MKINKEFINRFSPCAEGWKNYLKYYSDWEGTLKEFMSLEKIPPEDKMWLFYRDIPELAITQRYFAFICAARAVEECESNKVKAFFTLILLQFEEGALPYEKNAEYLVAYRAANDDVAYTVSASATYRATYSVADREAYRAAYRVAESGAYSAAGVEVQLEIIRSLL